jgi:hypothetical protein
MLRRNGTLLATVAAAGIVLAAAYSAFAVSSGDTIQFLIPAAANQPEPDVGPISTDVLIFIGRKTTTSPGTGCAPTGSYPVQNAVLVDPGGGRSERIVGVITTAQEGGGSDPLPPGTKITNIAYLADCNIGTDAYKKYSGTVE